MKTTRKMIPAIAMLLISAVMLTTASYAWFTIGTQATATGMSVTATSASSLLIAKQSEVAAGAMAAFSAANHTAEFDANNTALEPATKADNSVSTDNGLMAPGDTAAVDAHTGAYSGTFVAAAAGRNFVDYTACIAAAGADMANYALSATVTVPNTANLTSAPINNAVTVAFWVSTDKATAVAEVKDTANANHVNLKTAAAQTSGVKVELGNMTIPGLPTEANADVNYITVTMRVYFDGALVESDALGTYVRNSSISTLTLPFVVTFNATAPSAQG